MAEGPSSHPPSEPRTEKRSARDTVVYDRPARLQMGVALVLGLVLVAIPLYLWRRPRVESAVVVSDADGSVAAPVAADAQPAEDAGGAVALSEPKVLQCQDPGPGSTAPEKCDHLVDFEKAFAKAIQDSATCTSVAGTLPYVADVSFARKKQPVYVSVAKEGRTIKAKAAGCVAAVKKGLATVALDGTRHAHARYRISIVATYAASAK